MIPLLAIGKDGKERAIGAAIEGDLDLTATSDTLGHIRLDIILRNNNPEDDWKVDAPVYLDAGGLEALASKVRTFFTQTKQ